MPENPGISRTNAERSLAAALQRRGLSFKQNQLMEGFEFDFWFPEYRLVVEVDGFTHLSGKQQQLDRGKDRVLAEKGLMVLRVANQEVRDDLAGCVSRIESYIKQLKQLKQNKGSINQAWKESLKQVEPVAAKQPKVIASIEDYFLDCEGKE